MKVNKIITDQKRVTQLKNFLNLGFKDYIGSRVLINNELNLQGAILASTAIEKYFKALIAINGNTCKGHLKNALFNAVKNYDSKLFFSLNNSFLFLLKKIYNIRYYDNDIKPGFSVNICDKQFLAELDYSVSEIQKRITLNKNGEKVETRYETFLKNKNPLLYNNNYILQDIEKTSFIEQENSVYGILFDEDLNMIEIYYKTLVVKNDGDFMKPGLLLKKNKA